MYADIVNVEVLDNHYDDKTKKSSKKIATTFNFKNGIDLKDLSRFLDESQDTLQYRMRGHMTVNILIDSTTD